MSKGRLNELASVCCELLERCLAHGAHGCEDATAFCGDLCVRCACYSTREFMCAGAGKYHVRVRVDKSGQNGFACTINNSYISLIKVFGVFCCADPFDHITKEDSPLIDLSYFAHGFASNEGGSVGINSYE
jgi:hypothetical protein